MATSAQLPRWLGLVNRLNVFMLRRGFNFGPPLLLSVPGRKSGKLQTTPVSPVTVDGQRYIVAGFAGSDWVKNARAAGWGMIGRGKELERVKLIELALPDRSAIIREGVRQVPLGRGFIDVPPDAADEAFVAAAPKYPVFRVETIAEAVT